MAKRGGTEEWHLTSGRWPGGVALTAQCTELLFLKGFCILIFPGVSALGPSSAWLCISLQSCLGWDGMGQVPLKDHRIESASFWLGLELGLSTTCLAGTVLTFGPAWEQGGR